MKNVKKIFDFKPNYVLVGIVVTLLLSILILQIHILVKKNNTNFKRDLVVKVSQHVVLPESEPSIIEVTDADTLKADSSYYEGTENGDFVLVYPEKVVIYDPEEDVVINIINGQ